MQQFCNSATSVYILDFTWLIHAYTSTVYFTVLWVLFTLSVVHMHEPHPMQLSLTNLILRSQNTEFLHVCGMVLGLSTCNKIIMGLYVYDVNKYMLNHHRAWWVQASGWTLGYWVGVSYTNSILTILVSEACIHHAALWLNVTLPGAG